MAVVVDEPMMTITAGTCARARARVRPSPVKVSVCAKSHCRSMLPRSTMATLLLVAAATFSVATVAIRVEDLRERRPVEHAGLAQFMLHDMGEDDAFSGIVSLMGIMDVPVNRKDGHKTIEIVHRTLEVFDGKFAEAVMRYIGSVLASYNGNVHQYLSRHGRAIATDVELYAEAFRAIEFRDRSDGFAVLSYLHDAGLDPGPVFDNILFYTVPRVRPRAAEKPRPEDQILALSRFGSNSRVRSCRVEKDVDKATERMAKILADLETDLHRLSGKFSRGFGQWLRVYRYDEIEDPNDTSEVRRTYGKFKHSTTCKLWVNISMGYSTILNRSLIQNYCPLKFILCHVYTFSKCLLFLYFLYFYKSI